MFRTIKRVVDVSLLKNPITNKLSIVRSRKKRMTQVTLGLKKLAHQLMRTAILRA